MPSNADLVYILFDTDNTDFRIHVTSDIAPNYGADVTQYTVEDGSQISDHINRRPVTLALTCFMSELVGQEEFEQYDAYFAGEHIALHERLLQARLTGELVHIDAGPEKGIFADMAIIDYSPMWNNGPDGKSLNFTLSLQEVKFAETRTAKIGPKQRGTLALQTNSVAKITTGTNGIPADDATRRLFSQGAEGARAGAQQAIPAGGALELQAADLLKPPPLFNEGVSDWFRG